MKSAFFSTFLFLGLFTYAQNLDESFWLGKTPANTFNNDTRNLDTTGPYIDTSINDIAKIQCAEDLINYFYNYAQENMYFKIGNCTFSIDSFYTYLVTIYNNRYSSNIFYELPSYYRQYFKETKLYQHLGTFIFNTYNEDLQPPNIRTELERREIQKEIYHLKEGVDKIFCILCYGYICVRFYHNDPLFFSGEACKILDKIEMKDKFWGRVLIGDYYNFYNFKDLAIRSYFDALRYEQERIIKSFKSLDINAYKIALVDEKIGNCFENMNLFSAGFYALRYYTEAKQLYESINANSQVEIISSRINHLNCLLQVNKYNDSSGVQFLEFLDTTYKSILQMNLPSINATDRLIFKSPTTYYNLITLAMSFTHLNYFDKAIYYNQLALYKGRPIQNSVFNQFFDGIKSIAFNYCQLKKYDSALLYLNKGIEIANKERNYYYVASGLIEKSDVYANLNIIDSVNCSLKQAQEIIDSKINDPYLRTRLFMKLDDKFSDLYVKRARLTPDNTSLLDSILWYKKEHYLYVLDTHDDLENLVIEENVSSNIKIGSLFLKFLSLGNKEINDLENQKRNLTTEKRVLDSLVRKLTIDTSELGKHKLTLLDSIGKQIDKINQLGAQAKRYEQDIDNKKGLIKSLQVLVIAFLFLIGILVIVAISLKKKINAYIKIKKDLMLENEENNYKWKLHNANTEMKLLSMLAGNHDIDKFIPLMPKYIDSITPETKDKLLFVAHQFKKYYESINKKRNLLTNTIKSEIEIAKESTDIYLFTAKRKCKAVITTDFENNAEFENFEIPKFMMVSLIANSIKHGSINRDLINVHVSIKYANNDYFIYIEDDGVGFKSLNLDSKRDDQGINLILEQVKNFNEVTKEYKIAFHPQNIINKPNGTGVLVTFKINKNVAA